MNEKIAAMATPKRCIIDGHMQTVWLTDYQEDNDSYHGVAIRSRATGAEKLPVIQAVHGLRPYPYTERPGVQFQFVNAGEDESPLFELNRAEADHHDISPSVGGEPPQKTDAPPEETPTRQLTKAERKAQRKQEGQ